MEPTLLETLIKAVLSLLMAAGLLSLIVWYLMDAKRTHRCSTQNEYAYHSRRNNYEVQFITRGRG